MTVISMRNVAKRFKNQVLFSDVSLDIEAGQAYGLVGPNGSGKSVLLKMMCGFIDPDEGQVLVDPKYLSKGRTFPEKFGVAIDGPAYLPQLSAEANLLELAGIRGQVGIDEVRTALELVGLDARPRQRARTFSLGMKQKLSLAQAFMEEPEVLLLDEPFNGLDESSVRRIKSVMRALKSAGKTIVYTSHIRQDIDDLCDQVFQIDNQKVTAL